MSYFDMAAAPKDRRILVWVDEAFRLGGGWRIAKWQDDRHSKKPRPYFWIEEWSTKQCREAKLVAWANLPDPVSAQKDVCADASKDMAVNLYHPK